MTIIKKLFMYVAYICLITLASLVVMSNWLSDEISDKFKYKR